MYNSFNLSTTRKKPKCPEENLTRIFQNTKIYRSIGKSFVNDKLANLPSW